MFTGLVECTGKVLERAAVASGARYAVEIPFAAELALGDSVAVNGCCLTVDKVEGNRVEFDLLTQTLRVTSLGQLQVGSLCNLERAMGGNGRFGGHFVMGHVDTTAASPASPLWGRITWCASAYLRNTCATSSTKAASPSTASPSP